MKITNISGTVLQIADLLANGSATQWQDGVRALLIPDNEYRTIPNIQGANSVGVKALLTAAKVTVDTTVEPDGTDLTNPTWEVGGPIVGMPI